MGAISGKRYLRELSKTVMQKRYKSFSPSKDTVYDPYNTVKKRKIPDFDGMPILKFHLPKTVSLSLFLVRHCYTGLPNMFHNIKG